ncbi:hypothetical protein FRC07_006127 [Ceratobasidium sp. 392]|nr:hypothetical protein FRC07_006127 [Ceratobasidium sp. 392]
MESTQNATAEHEATVDPAAHGPTLAPTPDPLPFPLSPATDPTPATAAPPQRGSRVLACRDKRKRRRPYDGVRPVLPRKALKKTRATTATQVDTSHVSHQGQIGWQAALESVFRRSFPNWEATGYVPQYEIPHPPVSWTPVSTETAEAQQTGATEATAATHDEANAPTVGQPNDGDSAEDELAQLFSGAMQGLQDAESAVDIDEEDDPGVLQALFEAALERGYVELAESLLERIKASVAKRAGFRR